MLLDIKRSKGVTRIMTKKQHIQLELRLSKAGSGYKRRAFPALFCLATGSTVVAFATRIGEALDIRANRILVKSVLVSPK